MPGNNPLLRDMLIEAERQIPDLESLVKHHQEIADAANDALAMVRHELAQTKRLKELLSRMLDPKDWQQED